MPAKSKAQRRLMGMAKAVKEGKMSPRKSPAAARVARDMSLSELSDFAGTSEKGLPQRKKK